MIVQPDLSRPEAQLGRVHSLLVSLLSYLGLCSTHEQNSSEYYNVVSVLIIIFID
jgi:hypothetical protein